MAKYRFGTFLLAMAIALSFVLNNEISSSVQKTDVEHQFINSIYRTIIDTSLHTYNLYYKPIPIKFDNFLASLLSKYLPESDINFMKEKSRLDTSFEWHQEFLENCTVLFNRHRNVLKSYGNVVLLDSLGNRLAPELYPKAIGHNEFYYNFSQPIFNENLDFTYLQVLEYYGNRTRYFFYLFRKKGNGWEIMHFDIDSIESYQEGIFR